MFKQWKEAREKCLQCEAAIQQNDYLRRLRNSANMLSGLSHSGNGEELKHTLAIHEVRHVLRAALIAAQQPTQLTQPKGDI